MQDCKNTKTCVRAFLLHGRLRKTMAPGWISRLDSLFLRDIKDRKTKQTATSLHEVGFLWAATESRHGTGNVARRDDRAKRSSHCRRKGDLSGFLAILSGPQLDGEIGFCCDCFESLCSRHLPASSPEFDGLVLFVVQRTRQKRDEQSGVKTARKHTKLEMESESFG
ncbi:hypothetical protein BKA81DRAFT_371462 [Phyllosticta paracitricarpa]